MAEIEVSNLQCNNKNNVINYVNKNESKLSNKKPIFSVFDKLFNKLKTNVKTDNAGNNITKDTVRDNDDLTATNSLKLKGGNFTNFFKIKQVKTALIVLIFSVVALIILSSYNTSNTKTSSTSNSGYMTSLEYCEKLENKLMEVLGNISGVGDISVMVSVESGPEIKVATSTDEKTNTTTNSSGSTTTSTVVSDPIIINSSGNNSALVLSEISPKVTGVIVVASGAKDVKVRLNLLEAVKALLNVSSENIQIYY